MAVEGAEYKVDDGGLGPGDGFGGVAADGGSDDGKDAGADDGADAESGEGDGAEGLFEGVFGALGVGDELVDGLGSEDLSGQGSVLVSEMRWIELIVTAGSICAGDEWPRGGSRVDIYRRLTKRYIVRYIL
jgi:hypothetical protein